MISVSGESVSTSTSKRLRRRSTPASAIDSRTSTRTLVCLERGRDSHAALDLHAGLDHARLHGTERGGVVEDLEVADVADAEALAPPLALAADQLDAEPVAQIEQEGGHVEPVRSPDGRDDGGAVLVGRSKLEPHRLDSGTRRSAEPQVALERGLEALVEDQPERYVDPEHERHGGREGRVDLLLRGPGPFPVEIEARCAAAGGFGQRRGRDG